MEKLHLNQNKVSQNRETFFDPDETITLLNNTEHRKQLERLTLIYNDEPFTLTSYFIVTLIMTFMAWPHTNQFLISAWLITVTIVLCLRFILTLCFQAQQDKNIRPHKWQQRLTLLSFISGVVIGSCGFITLTPEHYLLPLILAIGLITLSSISVSVLSISSSTFISFIIPALLPVIANTLISGDRINFGIGLLIIMFTVTLILLSNRTRENINKSLDIRYENTHLLDDLTVSQLQLQKQNIELEKLATEDHLTGLANRRYGDMHLEAEWKKAIRQQHPVSLIMIDIDKFKDYNDHYGHQAGDDCLKIVAQALKQSLSRPSDLAVRYGGEEFLVVLPDTEITGAIQLARKFQKVLENVNIKHEYSDIANHLTVSCGVASYTPKRSDKVRALVNQADIAMYKSKFSGGNRTISFS